VKPFSQVVLTNLETHAIYSQVFDIEELSHHAPSLARCPIYTQQYVEKRFEHRAMVIGDQVLNCRMDTQASERTRIDFRRYDFAAVRHEPCALPSDIEAKLLAFMSAAELRYGAIDLIETPDGDFVFLEVNPSGQWEWISHFAGLDIPSAVARLLIT
jgi:glutathione synthase/RimK-type ligase-like ATP-grasp enzyme